MAVTPFQAVQQGGQAELAIESIMAPPTISPVAAPTAPLVYFDGQFPSFSRWIMRAVQVTAQSIIDPEQYVNRLSLVHDWGVEGRWQPLAQNIAVLTAQAAMVPATLVPNYGMRLDTAADVYRNIAAGGANG